VEREAAAECLRASELDAPSTLLWRKDKPSAPGVASIVHVGREILAKATG
jgi:hypothetical protein